MLGTNDLKRGTIFLFADQPYAVLESSHSKMAQSRPVMQTKIKNLITGNVISHSFKQGDRFEEVSLERKKFIFLYSHRGEYCFVDEHDKSKRFFLKEEQLGEEKRFLKQNEVITAVFFNDLLVHIDLPVKMDFKVVEAPPNIKGDTAQGGTKTVIIETGAKIQTPLFVEMGDIIRVNTTTGEYAERMEKGK
jgi:elongation factor P